MGKRRPKIEIYPAAGDDWRWRLLAGNGEISCHGEGYTSETDARRGALTAQSLMLESPRMEVVSGRVIS